MSRLKFRLSSLVILGIVAGSAGLAILLLAGPTKNLVVEHRFVMYSLFIGLTLGGLPIVWRLARPMSPPVVCGAAGGILIMAWMAFGTSGAGGSGANIVLLFLAGIAGASAMILPGISGSYLLLLLGQYVPILSAVDN